MRGWYCPFLRDLDLTADKEGNQEAQGHPWSNTKKDGDRFSLMGFSERFQWLIPERSRLSHGVFDRSFLVQEKLRHKQFRHLHSRRVRFSGPFSSTEESWPDREHWEHASWTKLRPPSEKYGEPSSEKREALAPKILSFPFPRLSWGPAAVRCYRNI